MLVERDHVLTALRELANDAAAGAGRLVFLGGEAGVGKTMTKPQVEFCVDVVMSWLEQRN